MRRARYLAAVMACGLAYSGTVAPAEGKATDRSPMPFIKWPAPPRQ